MAGLLSLWFTVGIVKDPEFDEYHLRWKSRPTYKVYFYSPVGMSDKGIEDLSPELQAVEKDYLYYIMGE